MKKWKANLYPHLVNAVYNSRLLKTCLLCALQTPCAPAIKDIYKYNSLRQRAFNQGVRSSILRRSTKNTRIPHGIRVFFMLSAPIDSVRGSFSASNALCSHTVFLSHCSIESAGVRNIAPPSRLARQQNYIPCSVERSPRCFSAQILRRSRTVFAYLIFF